MKKLLVAALLSVSSLALAGSWELDPAHSSANFTVRHMMITNVQGRLGNVSGTLDLDDKDVTRSKVDATIDVTGLNTNQEKRDKHLKSPDFFDVEKFPTMTFKSTKVEKNGQKLKITGDLTMHGVTKPVTLDAELSDEIANPMSNGMVRAVTASTTLNREDFGLTWNKSIANNGVLVGKEVKVTLDLELGKKGQNTAAGEKTPKK